MMTSTTQICPDLIFTPSDDGPITHLITPKSSRANILHGTKMIRKFSFPISLHSSSLLSETSPIGRTTRRLSNVSDRVSDRVRKLSTAMGMGWKSSIPKDLLISQGKCLCSQYIRCRLKRSGFTNHKKLGLQRMRSVLSIGVSEVREVFPALLAAIEELERLHPKLYINVSRQISNIHDLSSAEAAPILLGTVGRILFKNNEITWGKIVSLFCITGGLAEDLLRQQHIDFVPKLIDGFAGVLEDELVSWLSENHGWIALAHRLQIKKESCVYEWTVVIILFVIVISFFSLVNTYIISTKYINID